MDCGRCFERTKEEIRKYYGLKISVIFSITFAIILGLTWLIEFTIKDFSATNNLLHLISDIYFNGFVTGGKEYAHEKNAPEKSNEHENRDKDIGIDYDR